MKTTETVDPGHRRRGPYDIITTGDPLDACLFALGVFGVLVTIGLATIGLAGCSGATPPPQLVPLAAAASDTPAMVADWMIAADAERAALDARVTALEAGEPPGPPVTGWVRTEKTGYTLWVYEGGWTPTEDEPKLTLRIGPLRTVVRFHVSLVYTAPADWKDGTSLGWTRGPKWGRDLAWNVLVVRRSGGQIKLNSSLKEPGFAPFNPENENFTWVPGRVTESGGKSIPSLEVFPAKATWNLGHDTGLPEEPYSYGWSFSEIRITADYQAAP